MLHTGLTGLSTPWGLFEDVWAAGAHNQEDRANQRVKWRDLQAINPTRRQSPLLLPNRGYLSQDACDVNGEAV